MNKLFIRHSLALLGLIGCALGSAALLRQSAPQRANAVIVVNRADDAAGLSCDGAPNNCTLRSAIERANAVPGADTILFDADYTILLSSSLPALVNAGTVISAADRVVKIDGTGVAVDVFTVSGSNIAIQRLRVYGGSFSNINIGAAATRVRVDGNVIGDDDPAGGGCGQSNATQYGVIVSTSATAATGQRNVTISNNRIECVLAPAAPPFPGGVGVEVQSADDVAILFNRIGFNRGAGVRIVQTSARAYVAANNVSRNLGDGIVIGGGAAQSRVNGNLVGLDADGQTTAPNGRNGVLITDASFNTSVSGNIMSGNVNDGLRISAGTLLPGEPSRNTVYNNKIGTNISGTGYVPNGGSGVAIIDSWQNELFGNVVAGNAGDGLYLVGAHAYSNTISGKFFGNGFNGILIGADARDNVIGAGSQALEVPITQLSGNGRSGLYMNKSYSTIIDSVWVQANGLSGIRLIGASSNTVVTNTRMFANAGHGIMISDTVAGTRLNALSVHGNTGRGIDFFDNGIIDTPVATITSVSQVRLIAGITTGGVQGRVDVYRVDSLLGGEGATFVGSTQTAPGGSWQFTETFTATARPLALCYVTVLSTAAGSGEFSPPAGPGCVP